MENRIPDLPEDLCDQLAVLFMFYVYSDDYLDDALAIREMARVVEYIRFKLEDQKKELKRLMDKNCSLFMENKKLEEKLKELGSAE